LHCRIGIVEVCWFFVNACPIAPQQVAKNCCREADKGATDARYPNFAVFPAPGLASLEIFHKHCFDDNRGKKATIAILNILSFCEGSGSSLTYRIVFFWTQKPVILQQILNLCRKFAWIFKLIQPEEGCEFSPQV